MKKVLSIDGGGIRGIVPAYILMKLEHELQDHLCNYFDLVAGTSTGAIVGAGVASGKSMEDILELYFKEGPHIFEKNFKTRLNSAFGLIGGKHDVQNLIRILRENLGEGSMSELLKTDLLLTSYCMTEGRPRFFSKLEEGDLELSRVVAASAAAPTYFDPVVIDGKEYIDGGVFAGNPAMSAFAEIKDMYNLPAKEIFLVSLGTGNRLKEYPASKNWFKLKWINPLLEIMMAADGGVVHHQLTKIYQSIELPGNYYRITNKLPSNIDDDMGIATQENMNNLLEFAKHLAKKNERKIKEIAEKLR